MPNKQNITNASILTLDSDTVPETAQTKADITRHAIQNAYRTRRILTGMLGCEINFIVKDLDNATRSIVANRKSYTEKTPDFLSGSGFFRHSRGYP